MAVRRQPRRPRGRPAIASLRAAELGALEVQLRRAPGIWIVTGLPGIGTSTFLHELAARVERSHVLSRRALAGAPKVPARATLIVVDGVDALDRSATDRASALARAGRSVVLGAARPLSLPDARTLVLSGLSEAASLALFEAHRAAPASPADLAVLRRLGGHPLALVRLAERRLAPRIDELDAVLGALLDRPPSLLERVASHLDALPPPLAAALRVLAALPAAFDLTIAAAALERAPAETFALLDELARWGVVVPSGEAGAGPSRFVVPPLCRLRVPPPDRAPTGHLEVVLARAERLGALGPRHVDDARTLAADLPYLERLAEAGEPAASVAIDHHLRAASTFGVRAARLGRARRGGDVVELALARAEIALGLGDVGGALASLPERLPEDDERAALVHLRRAHALLRAAAAAGWSGERRRALDEASHAITRAEGTRAEPHVLAEAAYLEVHAGGSPDAARARLDRSMALASVPDAAGRIDELALARACTLDALLALHLGDLARAESSARSARVLAAALGDLRDERLASVAHAIACAELDREGDAEVAFARAVELAEQSGAQRAAAEYAGHAGAHALCRGDLARARVRLHRAVSDLERAGDLRGALLFEPFLVLARRLGGEPCDDPRPDEVADDRDPPERIARSLVHALALAAPAGRAALARALDRFLAAEAAARAPVLLGAELRLALRLARRLAAGPSDAAAIGITAPGRYALPGGRILSLEGQPVLARVLDFLIERARRAPHVPVPVDALASAGWPDERTIARSGAQRVHTAVRRLRRAGLTTLLRSTRDGYWLDARIEPVV